jgi:hypothetical protein
VSIFPAGVPGALAEKASVRTVGVTAECAVGPRVTPPGSDGRRWTVRIILPPPDYPFHDSLGCYLPPEGRGIMFVHGVAPRTIPLTSLNRCGERQPSEGQPGVSPAMPPAPSITR